MGFLDSIWTGVKEVFSKATKVVTETIKTVGKIVTERAKELVKLGVETLKVAVDVLEYTAKRLGIIQDDFNVEDIGDRAMRCDKKAENFDTYKDYIDYLYENVEPTPQEELEKLSPHERLARRAIGSAILSKRLEEELKLEIPMEFWKLAVKAGLSVKEIDAILTRFKSEGISPKDFAKYLKQELDMDKEEKVDSFLMKTFKELEPNTDEKDIEEKIISLQRNMNG
jgi:hypothetical protein